MASGSSAFPAKCGYNQSAGGYFIILDATSFATKSYSYDGTSMTALNTSSGVGKEITDALAPTDGTAAKLIKDMGKTVVISGRTYRKFQLVAPTNGLASPTFGVGGAAPAYTSFYLEVGREGANADTGSVALIARYA